MFNNRVHLLVKGVLMLSSCTVQQQQKRAHTCLLRYYGSSVSLRPEHLRKVYLRNAAQEEAKSN
jgi:hypothetical protein